MIDDMDSQIMLSCNKSEKLSMICICVATLEKVNTHGVITKPRTWKEMLGFIRKWNQIKRGQTFQMYKETRR